MFGPFSGHHQARKYKHPLNEDTIFVLTCLMIAWARAETFR